DGASGYTSGVKAAYDYRAFGEQIDLTVPTDKVTENFTGKERDDETDLNYFGARYLDPMLGLWISVDAKRQFSSPYLYAGNGVNPVNGVDSDGNVFVDDAGKSLYQRAVANRFWGNEDIRREFEFANTTSTKIHVKSQSDLIKGKYSGLMTRGARDEMEIDLYGVSDDYKLKEGTITLSVLGILNNAELTNTSYSESEARIAAHEIGAHIRNFTPNYGPNGESPADIEHDKFRAEDLRLDTPREGCLDE
ncbi:MAG: RHS repeat-associated core domain-containing protein, partial [Fibrobacteraceae bacterium]|nr:RHS repeat-associated core domain-containing protein [Fibrobacteraceae bacterium]